MERQANYAVIGVATTILILSGLIFAVWLANAQIGEKHARYRIIFPGPVRGIALGGEVQFNGIKVGEVTLVKLMPQDTSKILIDVEVGTDTPVRVDSTASTEMQGISGINAILISAGTPTKPLLRDTTSADPPVIQAKANSLASLLQGGGQVVESAGEVLGRLNRLLSDRNLATLSGTMGDIKLVTGELAANRAMFANANAAMAKLDATMGDAQRTMRSVNGLIEGDGKRTFANAADAAAELKVTIAQARTVLAGVASTSNTVGGSTLPQIADTMRSLQNMTQDLDTLLRQIRQDPRGTLLKGKTIERELNR